jgi:transcriptional antiterminator NusG
LKENPNIYQTLNYRNEKDKCIRIFSDPSLDADQRQLMEEAQFFKEIPSEEMLVLLKLINDSAVIDYSKVYFHESKVVVQAGPLKGMEKLIKKIDKHKQRAKVLMSMMGAEQLIDFGIEIVQSPMESNLAR